MSAQPWTPEQILEADKKYVIHSWSTQGALNPKVITGGEGSWFWDSTGKRYLDFQSQLVNLNLGHQHPKLVDAIASAAHEMCYIGPNYAVEPRAKLAAKMAEIAPGDLTMSFFTTGGAAANETAVRLARHVTGRSKVIARYRSYHGATAGALQLTGDPRRWAAEPFVGGVVRMLDPDVYRLAEDNPVNQGAPHLEEILQYENPETVAAIIVEPVTGTNGVLYPPQNYLAELRRVCDKYGIILIFDEVMVGFGRTGTMFASEHWGIVPDIMTSAKGINSGYVPLGVMTVNDAIGEWLQTNYFWGGQTYAGHPLACASGVAALDIMEEEQVLEKLAPVATYFGEQLHALADKHPSIGDVRGKGAFWGVELVRNRDTKEPLVPFNAKGDANAPMAKVCAEANAMGLYLAANNNVLRLAPPLIITKEEIDFAIDVMDQVLVHADAATEE